MLGISIFLSTNSAEQNESYIKRMKELGFTSIFTSLHIPEDDPSLYKDRIKALGELAMRYEMELFADISPKSLQYLGFTWENADQLTKWGLTGLRIDYGVSEETIAKLSKKMKLALNASTLTKAEIAKLKQFGIEMLNVEAWHNYYPRPETGLDIQEFNERNQWLKSEGLTVMAFIPGDGERRGPLFRGLPTLEDHRDLTTFAAYLEMNSNPWVDKILVGDPTVNEGSLRQFSEYQNDVVILRANCYSNNDSLKERLHAVQTNRWDSARDVIRSAESRQYGLIGDFPVRAENTIERAMGAITIDNENYGRYQGEIQIAKRILPADSKVNVIGQVIEEDLPLLSYIKGGVKFLIQWV